VEGEAVACDQAGMPSFEDAAVHTIAIDHTPKGKAHKDNEAGRSLAILARLTFAPCERIPLTMLRAFVLDVKDIPQVGSLLIIPQKVRPITITRRVTWRQTGVILPCTASIRNDRASIRRFTGRWSEGSEDCTGGNLHSGIRNIQHTVRCAELAPHRLRTSDAHHRRSTAPRDTGPGVRSADLWSGLGP